MEKIAWCTEKVEVIQNKNLSSLFESVSDNLTQCKNGANLLKLKVSTLGRVESLKDFMYCTHCELIIEKRFAYDLDQKIINVIESKGWPCNVNDEIHYYNPASSFQCSYVFVKKNKKCTQMMDSFYFPFLSIFKQFPIYKFLEEMSLIGILVEVIKNMKNCSIGQLVELIFRERKSMSEYLKPQLTEEYEIFQEKMFYLRSHLMKNIQVTEQFTRFLKKVKSFIKSVQKHSRLQSQIENMLRNLEIQFQKNIETQEQEANEKIDFLLNFEYKASSQSEKKTKSFFEALGKRSKNHSASYRTLKDKQLLFPMVLFENFSAHQSKNMDFAFRLKDFTLEVQIQYRRSNFFKSETFTTVLSQTELSVFQLVELLGKIGQNQLLKVNSFCWFYGDNLAILVAELIKDCFKEYQMNPNSN